MRRKIVSCEGKIVPIILDWDSHRDKNLNKRNETLTNHSENRSYPIMDSITDQRETVVDPLEVPARNGTIERQSGS